MDFPLTKIRQMISDVTDHVYSRRLESSFPVIHKKLTMLASNSNASENIQGMKRNSSFAQNPNKKNTVGFGWKKEFFCMYTLGFGGKNELLIIVWISSHAFELDGNVANLVYYGKTRMRDVFTRCRRPVDSTHWGIRLTQWQLDLTAVHTQFPWRWIPYLFYIRFQMDPDWHDKLGLQYLTSRGITLMWNPKRKACRTVATDLYLILSKRSLNSDKQCKTYITSNHRKTDVNVVALLKTLNPKSIMLDCQF